MAVWKLTDGYFGSLLSALLGQAGRRVEGAQNSGGGAGTGGGQSVTYDTALQLSAVWACVRLISEVVGAMPINVWRRQPDGSRVLAPDHWIGPLLRAPNRYQTRNEFIETLVMSLQLCGNCYARKTLTVTGDRQRIASLMPMMASQMTVDLLTTGERSYEVTSGLGVGKYTSEQIWHVPLMPSNGVVGLSPLQYGAKTMGVSMAADARVDTLARNGFKPTGVLTIDKILKDDQRDQIRGQFDDLITGQGDPLKVLEAGMKYQQVSMNPKDIQLLETRRFSIEDIARFFGVPSVLINDTSTTTAWGTGIKDIKNGFYTLALQPLLEKLEASITRWLLPVGDRGIIEVEFDFSAFLRGDEATRTETQSKAVGANLITINEARALEGRQPVPYGDVMYAQAQMIPIGTPQPEETTNAPQLADA